MNNLFIELVIRPLVQPRREKMEEPKIQTDPSLFIRQIEKNVLPASRVRRGVSKINRRVLRDPSSI